MSERQQALWRRLDVPGHDVCEVVATASGYRLEGTAVYLDARGPARVAYVVDCDHAWRSQSGHIHATIGTEHQELRITRTGSAVWTLNGRSVPGLDDCLDLDYGFTPATNLLQTRRIGLAVGGAADVPAAWIEPPDATLVRLPQRYARIERHRYRYDSPTAGYHEVLEMHASGFVRSYPGLWVLEYPD